MKKFLVILVLGLFWCNVGVAEKIPDMRNSVWEITSKYLDNSEETDVVTFNTDGTCSYPGMESTCTWKQTSNQLYYEFGNKYSEHNVILKEDTFSGEAYSSVYNRNFPEVGRAIKISKYKYEPIKSAKDKKIKELENRIKVLESRVRAKSRVIQDIQACLMADIEALMCAGID